MYGRRFFGFISALSLMLCNSVAVAFTAFISAVASLFQPMAFMQRNTQTPNLGMQRQQVGLFQRRLGHRGKRHQRMARGVFGSAALRLRPGPFLLWDTLNGRRVT
jgi:hypothetical protein